MENRYPGNCNTCGVRVRKQTGTAVKSASGRWIVLCSTHSGGDEPARIATFNIGGRDYYRNSRGRCEDAPCCGCCTI